MTVSGSSSKCPAPVPRSGTVFCNNDTNVCMDGLCTGSICEAMGMIKCQCSGPGINETTLCHVCCQPEPTEACQSTFELFGAESGKVKIGGMPCNNFEGHCSGENPPRLVLVFSQCNYRVKPPNRGTLKSSQKAKLCGKEQSFPMLLNLRDRSTALQRSKYLPLS